MQPTTRFGTWQQFPQDFQKFFELTPCLFIGNHHCIPITLLSYGLPSCMLSGDAGTFTLLHKTQSMGTNLIECTSLADHQPNQTRQLDTGNLSDQCEAWNISGPFTEASLSCTTKCTLSTLVGHTTVEIRSLFSNCTFADYLTQLLRLVNMCSSLDRIDLGKRHTLNTGSTSTLR